MMPLICEYATHVSFDNDIHDAAQATWYNH